MIWEPLWLSYRVAFVATGLTLVIGVALATLLARTRFPGREILDAVVTIPLVLPPTVLGYYVLTALGRNSYLGELYESITGGQLIFSVSGCVVAAFLGSLPLMVKSARAALEGVDEELVHAARTLGASPVRAFFTVQLPLAVPGLFAGLMLAFARALGDFGVTLMVAGNIPGETQTASLYIYDQIMANQEANAAGMIAVLTGTAIFTLWAVNRLTRGRGVA